MITKNWKPELFEEAESKQNMEVGLLGAISFFAIFFLLTFVAKIFLPVNVLMAEFAFALLFVASGVIFFSIRGLIWPSIAHNFKRSFNCNGENVESYSNLTPHQPVNISFFVIYFVFCAFHLMFGLMKLFIVLVAVYLGLLLSGIIILSIFPGAAFF